MRCVPISQGVPLGPKAGPPKWPDADQPAASRRELSWKTLSRRACERSSRRVCSCTLCAHCPRSCPVLVGATAPLAPSARKLNGIRATDGTCKQGTAEHAVAGVPGTWTRRRAQDCTSGSGAGSCSARVASISTRTRALQRQVVGARSSGCTRSSSSAVKATATTRYPAATARSP